MDIIIKNGVIQNNNTSKTNYDNIEKKNYEDFNNEISGPYYDLLDSHLCIPRFYYQIKNFCGPQIKKRIKLIKTDNYNIQKKYCSICHCEIKFNLSFSNKRKIGEMNLKDNKKHISDNLINKFNSITINNKDVVNKDVDNKELDKMNLLTKKFKVFKLDIYNEKWKILFNKIKSTNNKNILYYIYYEFKDKEIKIISIYYKILYKLLYKPILYNIGLRETKLLWPWELTNFQKFKLNIPNYKSSVLFPGYYNKIDENYVVIE